MNEQFLGDIAIGLSAKQQILVKLVDPNVLPPGSKVIEEEKGRRTAAKAEKDTIVIPDGTTVRITSPYSEETKKGLEIVGPKTLGKLVESINKAWVPKSWEGKEKIMKWRKDDVSHGVHLYTVTIA